jgi:hypothetical protein
MAPCSPGHRMGESAAAADGASQKRDPSLATGHSLGRKSFVSRFAAALCVAIHTRRGKLLGVHRHMRLNARFVRVLELLSRSLMTALPWPQPLAFRSTNSRDPRTPRHLPLGDLSGVNYHRQQAGKLPPCRIDGRKHRSFDGHGGLLTVRLSRANVAGQPRQPGARNLPVRQARRF